jgi:hypothetical protein
MTALRANLILTSILLAILGTYSAVVSYFDTPAPVSINAYKAASTTKTPHMARMVNCEDYDIQPCFTYDDGHWRVVTSYMPYASYTLYRCTEEDGGARIPCIWKDYNKVAKSQPRTKNVFTK